MRFDFGGRLGMALTCALHCHCIIILNIKGSGIETIVKRRNYLDIPAKRDISSAGVVFSWWVRVIIENILCRKRI
jgi:hypothetical protein